MKSITYALNPTVYNHRQKIINRNWNSLNKCILGSYRINMYAKNTVIKIIKLLIYVKPIRSFRNRRRPHELSALY